MTSPKRNSDPLENFDVEAVETSHPRGMTVQEIVDLFTDRGVRLTEATFRKYVQLGLLPRSVRVGRKGKHRGSLGLYPVTTVRQIAHIRRLMGQGFTIEEIQREFLFVRADVEALHRQLDRVYSALDAAVAERGGDEFVRRTLDEAQGLGRELLRALETIEQRLSAQARMARAAV